MNNNDTGNLQENNTAELSWLNIEVIRKGRSKKEVSKVVNKIKVEKYTGLKGTFVEFP